MLIVVVALTGWIAVLALTVAAAVAAARGDVSLATASEASLRSELFRGIVVLDADALAGAVQRVPAPSRPVQIDVESIAGVGAAVPGEPHFLVGLGPRSA